MAAIDPSASLEHTGTADKAQTPRATLKLVYDPSGPGAQDGSSDAEDDYHVEGDEDAEESQSQRHRKGRHKATNDSTGEDGAANSGWLPEALLQPLSSSEDDDDVSLLKLATQKKPRKEKERRRKKPKPFPLSREDMQTVLRLA